jgi:hypothetical protein
MAYDRTHRATVSHAQAIIDIKHSDLLAAHVEIRRLTAELDAERARRIVAEMRIEEILDTPI